jgi:signal transduction histidine kinase
MARLAQDLADSAQMMAGRFQIRTGPCDLVEIVREQVEVARSRTNRHTILFDAPPSLPIECDRDRLAQVLSNLLTNAVRYASSGEIRVLLERNEDQAKLTVSDQGPGIAPEHAELVFEPGRRLVEETESNGRGFGLHIVKGIVEAHGGRIWVEPTADPGATLRVTLPLAALERTDEPTSTAEARC